MASFMNLLLLSSFLLSGTQKGTCLESNELEESLSDKAPADYDPKVTGGLSSADRPLQFPLWHCTSNEKGAEFTKSGDFTARLRTTLQRGQRVTRLKLQRRPLSSREQEELKELVRTDGLYRIRIPASVVEDSNETVLASIPARCLAAANLEEHFELQLDLHGHVLAVGYTAPATDCPVAAGKEPSTWEFQSSAVVKMPLQAPRLTNTAMTTDAMQPPKAKRTKKGDPKLEGKEGEEEVVEEEKTFLQKYWMYLLGAGFVLLQIAATAPQEGPPAQGQQRPGTGPPAQRPGRRG